MVNRKIIIVYFIIAVIFISGCLELFDIRRNGAISIIIDTSLEGGEVNITVDDPCYLDANIKKGAYLSLIIEFKPGTYNVSCYHYGVLRFWEIVKVSPGETSEVIFSLQKNY